MTEALIKKIKINKKIAYKCISVFYGTGAFGNENVSWRVAQVVACLPSNIKALSLNSSTTKRKKERENDSKKKFPGKSVYFNAKFDEVCSEV
jgi:hypothetical protein